MARPPLPLGHHGTVMMIKRGKSWAARCRVRDLDGVTRQLERRGPSRTAAQKALQDELRRRHGQRVEVLRPYSRFTEAVDIWQAKIRQRREDSTQDVYAFWLGKVVLPQLGELRLIECDVANIDAFFSRLERERKVIENADGSTTDKPRYAANSRRTIRTIVSGVLQQAVLHQAIASNPVRELERIESPKGHKKTPPRGLTAAERRRLLEHVDRDPGAIAADLPDIIRFAIGTGMRIGELCAVRWMDVNLDGLVVVNQDDMRVVPVVAVRQNVYPVKGKGLVVHGGKTSMALRIVPLPEFVVRRLRDRRFGDEPPEMPVFASAGRDGQPTYRWPSTLRRRVRTVRAEVGLNWMTPHTWRRTFATILDDEVSLTDRAKADLLGQSKFLKDTYVSRGELHPAAAIYLDTALR
ncbi:MAG: tyrosine-type recombinase/integrase [Actinomycetia bacterium]|nr:tyrosine-type recombinase/integrase [Actinomycetes bacterium]